MYGKKVVLEFSELVLTAIMQTEIYQLALLCLKDVVVLFKDDLSCILCEEY